MRCSPVRVFRAATAGVVIERGGEGVRPDQKRPADGLAYECAANYWNAFLHFYLPFWGCAGRVDRRFEVYREGIDSSVSLATDRVFNPSEAEPDRSHVLPDELYRCMFLADAPLLMDAVGRSRH